METLNMGKVTHANAQMFSVDFQRNERNIRRKRGKTMQPVLEDIYMGPMASPSRIVSVEYRRV